MVFGIVKFVCIWSWLFFTFFAAVMWIWSVGYTIRMFIDVRIHKNRPEMVDWMDLVDATGYIMILPLIVLVSRYVLDRIF